MKKINDGFPTIKQAKKGFEDFISALAKAYKIGKSDEYYNIIVYDAAAMLGSLKARMENKKKHKVKNNKTKNKKNKNKK
jgi:hypothetical protein